MAITTQSSSAVYEMGVSSYAVNFPFLDVAHIYCAVSVDDGVTYSTLDASAYTVERYESGLGLVTVDDVMDDTAKLFIWREVPITQPTVYPRGGAFPASSHETALDRLTMVVQEINRKVVALTAGDDGTVIWVPAAGTYYDVATWADATARAAKVPNRPGQLGVQLDDRKLWIATGTLAGNWAVYNPAGSADEEITLVLAGNLAASGGDAYSGYGISGGDAFISLGDCNINGPASIDDDYSGLGAAITDHKFYPVLGATDISDPTKWDAHVAKFTYLPGNRRYYNKVLGNGLVEIFMLHSNAAETDGNGDTSTQHAWFVTALAASTARWKIACFFHPPISTDATAGVVSAAMQWDELRQMDAIFCSSTKSTEWLVWQGVPLLNLGSALLTTGTPDPATDLGVFCHALYLDGSTNSMARVRFNKRRALAEIISADIFAVPRYVRELTDLTQELENFTFEVLSPTTTPTTSTTYFVAYAPRSIVLREVMVSCATAGSSDISWQLRVDGAALSTGPGTLTLSSGQHVVRGANPAFAVIPAGSKIELRCSSMTLYAGWLGAALTLRGRAIE